MANYTKQEDRRREVIESMESERPQPKFPLPGCSVCGAAMSDAVKLFAVSTATTHTLYCGEAHSAGVAIAESTRSS